MVPGQFFTHQGQVFGFLSSGKTHSYVAKVTTKVCARIRPYQLSNMPLSAQKMPPIRHVLSLLEINNHNMTSPILRWLSNRKDLKDFGSAISSTNDMMDLRR
ncbi:hypothetical protein Taro_004667 [Colocasia esculenta]|uniref:Uncharacterized protein n=1 Tax=Colocasia esculenta TaxID=4460 RepID=A0A843TMY8_COLES|nr:hypothetical protein [Colocasia esculenta]